MNTWVEAPPRRKGLGCFARGCLIFLIFAIVLAIACFAGMSWGLHRHSALFYGSYWLAKSHSIAEAPTPVPEFTGSDGLIAANENMRGKVFASIEGNRLHLQTSAPIGGFFGRPGYYFNGDVTVELNGPQSLENPQVSQITVNGEQVPTDFLNWKYRSRQLREYLLDQRNAYDLGTIEIRDGKVILRSRND